MYEPWSCQSHKLVLKKHCCYEYFYFRNVSCQVNFNYNYYNFNLINSFQCKQFVPNSYTCIHNFYTKIRPYEMNSKLT